MAECRGVNCDFEGTQDEVDDHFVDCIRIGDPGHARMPRGPLPQDLPADFSGQVSVLGGNSTLENHLLKATCSRTWLPPAMKRRERSSQERWFSDSGGSADVVDQIDRLIHPVALAQDGEELVHRQRRFIEPCGDGGNRPESLGSLGLHHALLPGELVQLAVVQLIEDRAAPQRTIEVLDGQAQQEVPLLAGP
jgi:hypothetical protein